MADHPGAHPRDDRRVALLVAVLFITATVAALVGSALSQPLLDASDYLRALAGSGTRATAGALFEVLAAATSVGIAVALYPVLAPRGRGAAVGAVAFRTIEAAMYLVSTAILLELVVLGQNAPAVDATTRALGDLLVGLRSEVSLVGVVAFTVGAFLYYVVFFRWRLVPRWLAGWGILGVVLLLAACVVAAFAQARVQDQLVLVLPIAVQEMVLAVWLIVKGFTWVPLDADPGSVAGPSAAGAPPRRGSSS